MVIIYLGFELSKPKLITIDIQQNKLLFGSARVDLSTAKEAIICGSTDKHCTIQFNNSMNQLFKIKQWYKYTNADNLSTDLEQFCKAHNIEIKHI